MQALYNSGSKAFIVKGELFPMFDVQKEIGGSLSE